MIKAIIFDLGGVLVNSPPSDVESYRKEIRLHEDVLALARQLKSQGFKISILSNTIPEHVAILTTLNFFDYFDDRVFSYEVGLEKPDPGIYELALKRLGVDVSETILVDDKDIYVDGAIAAGIKGIVYKNTEQLKNDIQKLLD